MKIQGISKIFTKLSLAAITVTAGAVASSCSKIDERYPIEEIKHQKDVNYENSKSLFNVFLKDMGMLSDEYKIESIPSVKVEADDSTKIYSIYDSKLNKPDNDTLWLRQLVLRPNNVIYNTDTFLFYKDDNKLCVKNKKGTIKDIFISRSTDSKWNEFLDKKQLAQWYKIDDDCFVRQSGNNIQFYKNPEIAMPPSIP